MFAWYLIDTSRMGSLQKVAEIHIQDHLSKSECLRVIFRTEFDVLSCSHYVEHRCRKPSMLHGSLETVGFPLGFPHLS